MDASEWSHLVRQHAPLVWQTAGRLLPDPADAADCFQDTFVSAWKVAERQPVRNWPGLLQRLATAGALDRLRARRRHGDRHPAADLGEIPSAAVDPSARAETAELAAELRRALATLPRRQSQAYCLRHLNGFSYEQVAAELSMSVSAVGVTLHRAGRRLRTALAAHDLSAGGDR